MEKIELYKFQKDILKKTNGLHKCALYLGMGCGKTILSTEHVKSIFKNRDNILVICQKSKISDWYEHLNYYCGYHTEILSDWKLNQWKSIEKYENTAFIINYDLVYRRKEINNIINFHLILDESSLIQHEHTKRTKAIMKLNFLSVTLLSGTVISGKYEHLWSQLVILGWDIRKRTFWNRYVDYEIDKSQGFPLMIVHGYKREENLHKKMAEYGCVFLKTEDAVDLPEAQNIDIKVQVIDEYKCFRRDHIVTLSDGTEIVGDNILTQLLGERQLCGICNQNKLDAFKDLIESTSERVIVFYNFTAELEKMKDYIEDRPVSIVNGETKDLNAYNEYDNSVTFIQYQAGAMGLNLQKAHITVYFTPPLSSELYEQSLGRTRRIGQNNHCMYYHLVCENSVEEKIYRTLAMRMDYTERLFEKDIS